MGLSTYSLRAFIERDKVVQTDDPGGCYYDLEPYKIERIKRYEKRHKVLVYHVLNQVKPGVVHREVWLYVSDNPKTWPEDIADLEKAFRPATSTTAIFRGDQIQDTAISS